MEKKLLKTVHSIKGHNNNNAAAIAASAAVAAAIRSGAISPISVSQQHLKTSTTSTAANLVIAPAATTPSSHHQSGRHRHNISSSSHNSQLPQQQQHNSHLNNNNNNNNNRPSTKIVSQGPPQASTTSTQLKNHNTSSTHNNNNNNNNNNSNNNSNGNLNSNALASARAAACIATPLEQLTAVHAKATAVRNKNEEAISDLRNRIPEIENIFDVHSRIGNGTFSTVLLGTLKKERDLPENARRKFAIKHHIPTSHPDRIMKELQCMAKIGGTDNVVGINCCIRYNESVAFIMPYLAHDRFHDFFNKMDVAEIQYYLKNLLIALRHVHKFNVIHRDVKPSNFLYNRRKRQFLLVDFGLAQQVPSSHMELAASGGGGLGLGVTATSGKSNSILLPTPSATSDGKRAREQDESHVHSKTVAAVGNNTNNEVISGTAKRLRCSGPQGDQQVTGATRDSTAASPFKMPLKQINEINPSGACKATTTTASAASMAATGGTATTPHSEESSVASASPANGRNGKCATFSASLSSRLQQKMHSQSGQNAANSGRSPSQRGGSNVAINGTIAGSAATGSAANVATSNVLEGKHSSNRNLGAANGPKCYCYGNPQVCNICLIRKEIHASRAGTPGYRPPEVLLKYPDQTTAVDVWAAGVIFLSILSSVYPFFKAPNDYVALAEMVTIFGDKTIRKTAFVLDRLVTLSQKTKPLDLRKLCVRFRNRAKFSSPELLRKYQRADGSCEVCKNCDQFFFNCLCSECSYHTEPLDNDDMFPASAYDLLYKLLEVNPHKRITAEEALKHPFFQECNNNVSSKAHLTTSTSALFSNAALSTPAIVSATGDACKRARDL